MEQVLGARRRQAQLVQPMVGAVREDQGGPLRVLAVAGAEVRLAREEGGKWYSRGNWKGPFVEAEEEAGWECGGTAAAAEEEKVVVGVSWPTAPREDEDVVVKDGAGVAIVLLCGLLLWILFIVGDNDDDDVVEGTFVGSLLELLIGYDGGSSRITRPLPMVGTW